MTTTTAAPAGSLAARISRGLRQNRARMALLAALFFIFFSALFAMDPSDWFITVIRGIAVGAITFLVASGLSLIFGLMDVLNLAHGELFMLGAYVGWTVFVRPDTFMDLLVPVLLVSAMFALWPLWRYLVTAWTAPSWVRNVAPWIAVLVGLLLIVWVLPKYPLSIWNADEYAESPINNAVALDSGIQEVPESEGFDGIPAIAGILVLLLGGALVTFGVAAARYRKAEVGSSLPNTTIYAIAGGLVLGALIVFVASDPVTEWLYGLSTTWRFFFAMVVTTLGGFVIGAAIEVVLIRPLYGRVLYQLMITLGLGFVIIEVVRYVWGRPEFTMPKPALLAGSGEGCPGEGLGGFFSGCATVKLAGSRIRMYNEVFIILVGLVVLIVISLLLRRTRLGMIIRAGVQDREMVQALGINVQRVFTIAFGIGVSLAALGGIIAAPSIGLSTDMGGRVLLLALIAMAVGGLTSFPGTAAGALLVGILQQLIIKYGSVGIPLPFLDEPWKPSPPLVPVSTILLMVVVLLVLPQGLFGREES